MTFDVDKWFKEHLVHGPMKLAEAHAGAGASESGGTKRKVTIIEAGWGTSGYYPREVLERDGPKVFGKGTHMHLDHPSLSDSLERPERSLTTLVGTIDGDPYMEGNELVGDVKIYDHWAPVINAMADDIGVSIFAMGEAENGEVDGREGPIVSALTEAISVDYVTHAGAGGKVGALIESAVKVGEQKDLGVNASAASAAETKEEPVMGDDEKRQLTEATERLTKLEERIGTLETERDDEKTRADRAEDALLQERARRVVEEALAAEPADGEDALPELPERAMSRVVDEALKGKLPTDEDGKLDKDRLAERARKAVRDEAEYLHGSDTETGKVSGMGVAESKNGKGSGSSLPALEPEVDEATEKSLNESFQRLGMSEDAAKVAAKGR